MLTKNCLRVGSVFIVLFLFVGMANAMMVYQYNMGPAASVAGYTDIDRTLYNATDGYGWTYRIVSGVLDEYYAPFRTRGANPDAVLDTVVLDNRVNTDSRAYTLRFDIPDGLYTVTMTIGDHYVSCEDMFVIGDVLTTSTYGDFLALDSATDMRFDSGVVSAGTHVATTSPQFEVTDGYICVGWGKPLGSSQTWATVNSIVITEVPEPVTLGLLGSGFVFLIRRRVKK